MHTGLGKSYYPTSSQDKIKLYKLDAKLETKLTTQLSPPAGLGFQQEALHEAPYLGFRTCFAGDHLRHSGCISATSSVSSACHLCLVCLRDSHKIHDLHLSSIINRDVTCWSIKHCRYRHEAFEQILCAFSEWLHNILVCSKLPHSHRNWSPPPSTVTSYTTLHRLSCLSGLCRRTRYFMPCSTGSTLYCPASYSI